MPAANHFDFTKDGIIEYYPGPLRDKFGRFRSYGSCCICGGELDRFGSNNPEPFMSADKGMCCGGCNALYVIPARMREAKKA